MTKEIVFSTAGLAIGIGVGSKYLITPAEENEKAIELKKIKGFNWFK
ncbi:hypothetical protein [Candidatus Mycoplasma haematohominis]|nr:hypothetical protein [Candidatus Mycoplasma haemohominis]